MDAPIPRALITLLRPRQWIKNIFVLAPLIFAGRYTDIDAVITVLAAVALFSLAASAVYIVNDLRDMEADRRHPQKAHSRPLASGAVSPRQAIVLLMVLYGLLLAGWALLPAIGVPILAYLLLNLAYSYYLKHQPVLDVFCVALGFVLRVYAGAAVLALPLSPWMFVTTLSLALFLATIKRRQELRHNADKARDVLAHYTPALVERYAEIAGTGALVFYSLYVMSIRPELVPTIPFVLFGLFRYWYIAEALDGGESPTDALLGDKQLMLTVVLWGGTCIGLMA